MPRPFRTLSESDTATELSPDRFGKLVRLLARSDQKGTGVTEDVGRFLEEASEEESVLMLAHLVSSRLGSGFDALQLDSTQKDRIVKNALDRADREGLTWTPTLDLLAETRIWFERDDIQKRLQPLQDWLRQEGGPAEVGRLLEFHAREVRVLMAWHARALTPEGAKTLMEALTELERYEGKKEVSAFISRTDLPEEARRGLVGDLLEGYLLSEPRDASEERQAEHRLGQALAAHGLSEEQETLLWNVFKGRRESDDAGPWMRRATGNGGSRGKARNDVKSPPRRAVPLLVKYAEMTPREAEEVLWWGLEHEDINAHSPTMFPIREVFQKIPATRVRELLNGAPLTPPTDGSQEARSLPRWDWKNTDLARALFTGDIEERPDDPVLTREEAMGIGWHLLSVNSKLASRVIAHPHADREFWLGLLDGAERGERARLNEALSGDPRAARDPEVRKKLLASRGQSVLWNLFYTSTSATECDRLWKHMSKEDRRTIIERGPPEGVTGLKEPAPTVMRLLQSEDSQDRVDALAFLPALDPSLQPEERRRRTKTRTP